MKQLLISILFLYCVFGLSYCKSKEEIAVEPTIPTDTIINSLECPGQSIRFLTAWRWNDTTATSKKFGTTYLYNSKNQIDSIENGIFGVKYTYQNDLLVQLNYYTKDSIVKKKTLSYNDKRLLVEIKTFEVGVKNIYKSSTILSYNARKEPVSQVENSYSAALSFNTTYQYEWKNGNVINEKYYTNDVLHFEVNREYDDKHNFRPIDYDGTKLVHSRNNVLKATYKNHSGVYELWTNPGINTYQYNKDGLPITHKKKGGSLETFEYECF